MINVELIHIDVHLPSNEMRFVAMQPFIQFHSNTEEPYRWADNAAREQLAAIQNTLEVAQNGFKGHGANFTLFPEYSVPGIAGVALINGKINLDDWPINSIIIAGIHGIVKEEYRAMCDLLEANVRDSNAPDAIPDDQWVNCCVIWVKDNTGIIHKWMQIKVRPAWPEMRVACNQMFSGTTNYVFECQYSPSGVPCRFTTVICFDWIASIAGDSVCQELFLQLTELSKPNLTQLDWVFVIQHNPGPNSESFLNSTRTFLTDVNSHPFVEIGNAIIVHANTAISQKPIRTGPGGFSACILAPNAPFDCSFNLPGPTVCLQPKLLRNSNILERCKDIVFREMGECFHEFSIRVPRFVTADARDRTVPMPIALVHAVRDSADPRLPDGRPVPAAVKWINDSLDTIEMVSQNELLDCPLRQRAIDIEPTIINSMRISDGHTASNYVNWATCSVHQHHETRDIVRRGNSDIWGDEEANAVKHVLHSLTSLGLVYDIEIENSSLHGTLIDERGFVQVVAISGVTHEDCRIHYDQFILKNLTDPVLVITGDSHGLIPTEQEYRRIDDMLGEKSLAFIDYHTLITNCRNARDLATLKTQIDEKLEREIRFI